MSLHTQHTPESLRARAQETSSSFPALLADAHHLAATVLLGAHGRRQAGLGESFWQYRPAQPGDSRRRIDWRQSARSDGHYVRETEWQTPQSVMLWVDDATSMHYSGNKSRPSKRRRAQTLALAVAILAQKGGERVGLMNFAEPPRSDQAQLHKIATALMEEPTEAPDYGAPKTQVLPFGCRVVMISDFLGNLTPLQEAVGVATDRGVRGALLHVLDPVEESFPFDGRVLFQSMTGVIEFETLKARNLRAAYIDRLAAQKEALKVLCKRTGWQYHNHWTDRPAEPALLWLYQALQAKI